MRRCLSIFIFLQGLNAFGFDPTTIALSTKGLGSILETANDAADTGFAYSELLNELDVDNSVEDDINKNMRRLNEINNQLKEYNYSRESFREAIEVDLKNAKTITQKLKALRNLIRASKRIALLMGISSKTGERAANIQSIKVQTMMLEELQGMRREQYLLALSQREAQAKRELYLEEISNEYKGKNR